MLDLETLDRGRFRVRPTEEGATPATGNVFGGLLLAQLVMAASRALDDGPLSSLHTVFSRAVRADHEYVFATEVLASGRNAASASVTIYQRDHRVVHALALRLQSQDLPLVHQSVEPPEVCDPDSARPVSATPAVEVRAATDVDLREAETVAPPAIALWIRPRIAVEGPSALQAMLAYASEPHFFGASFLPHAGWSEAAAFSAVIPAVVSHTLSFHADPATRDGWWLFEFSSPHLAGGRVFGRADVFAGDGRLVASITQENLLRPVQPAR